MKNKLILAFSFFQLLNAKDLTHQKNSKNIGIDLIETVHQLPTPPEKVEYHHEIATHFNDQLPELWNKLIPEERIFAYYMMHASIPGNCIIADPKHRNAVEIIGIFYTFITHKELIYKYGCKPIFTRS